MISAVLTVMIAAAGADDDRGDVPPTPWAVVPPWNRHVEHHDRERERREDGQQRHRALGRSGCIVLCEPL